jgi:hypothetical protein
MQSSLGQSKKDNDALIEENRCMQRSLEQSKKDNDALIEENRCMQDSQEQINTHVKELYNGNNELCSQISSQRKFYTELTNKHLEEIKSLKSMINALEKRLVYTAEEVSLKDSNIAIYRERIKELNQNMDNRDYLIFRLKDREKDLEDKLKLKRLSQGPNRAESSDKVQKNYDANSLENPAKHGGITDETTCSKNLAALSNQKLAEQNITSAVPSIAILGAGKALLKAPVGDATSMATSEEYITPFMFHVMYFILAILVIWCIFKLIEKFQSSSAPKDNFVHFPEKMVYISDRTPASSSGVLQRSRCTQSQRLLHN